MIDRPHVCHLYFSNCNAIDVLNQSRTGEALDHDEWLLQNRYFSFWHYSGRCLERLCLALWPKPSPQEDKPVEFC